MPEEQLESDVWRVFRIFMSTLSDAELETMYEQLQNESASRRERDRDITRLFFSSLSVSDLERAGQQIVAEQTARLEDLRMLGLLTEAETSVVASERLDGGRPQERATRRRPRAGT